MPPKSKLPARVSGQSKLSFGGSKPKPNEKEGTLSKKRVICSDDSEEE